MQEAVALARAGSHTASASNARGSNITGTGGSGSSRGEYAPVGRVAEDGDEDEVSASASVSGTGAVEIFGRRGAADAKRSASSASAPAADHTAVEMTQSIM